MYRDSILLQVPLDRTIDLSSIVATCRERTLNRIYQRYPQLCKKKQSNSYPQEPDDVDDGDDEEAAEEDGAVAATKTTGTGGGETSYAVAKEKKPTSSSGSAKKKPLPSASAALPKNHHVPRREEYGNMVEYLEAKFVQGVMIHGDDQVDGEGASDEGAGSVYSDDSFFDDTELQRGVAHQVLALSTTTRLELDNTNNNQDQDDFFVNVGNLEVEESEYTQEQYDPLQDVDKKQKQKKPAGSKKRKKPNGDANVETNANASGTTSQTTTKGTTTAAATATATTTTTTTTTAGAQPQQPKKKAKSAASPESKPKKSKDAAAAGGTPAMTGKNQGSAAGAGDDLSLQSSPEERVGSAAAAAAANSAEALETAASEKKERVDELYDRLVQLIPHENFPQRRTKDRVSLTCPADKKPGDSILFSNPHVPGQRLKVQIPKNTPAGASFKVTVPVKEELDEAVDYNKLSRDFYNVMDEYARCFDDWCDALGAHRKFVDENDCSAHFEKRKKFDALLREFPTDLKTPVDKAYLQKILRRARQNRSKREQNAKLKEEKGGGGNGGGEATSSRKAGNAASSLSASPTSSVKDEANLATSAAAIISAKAQAMIRRNSLGSNPNAGSETNLAGKKPEAVRTKPMGVPSLFHEFMRKQFDEADFD